MIVRPHLNWIQLLFVWRGSILKKILPQLTLALLLSLGVLLLHGQVLR